MNKVLKGSGSKTYTLEKVIGKGSFGKVYASGQYAIKQICLLNMEPYLQKSLQTQIQIMRSFNHPNIVSLFDVIRQENYVYIVMEYCKMDLSKFMKTTKIDQAKAKKILKQIIAGFSQLIQKGIIHRDLKPANILVSQKGQFKLADFGFAKYVDKFHIGTPLYMAPQILQRVQYTTKCDIWSIGIIYFELLTCKTPWTASSQKQLFNNIMKKPLVIPQYVSQWSSTLLKQMLVTDQKKRIGWNQFINYILSAQKSNDSSQNSQKQIPLQRKPSQQQFQNALTPSNYISAKKTDLLLLFQLELMDYFSEQKAIKMVNQKNYQFSSSQIEIIKKVMNNFTPNYQTFIQNTFKIKL